ncbi:DinB family protein [soil metagenome]
MADTALTPEALLAHWRGHRRLTRRTIEAFAERDLFGFTPTDMRSFGAMMLEVIALTKPVVEGALDGSWHFGRGGGDVEVSKAELLAAFDEADAVIAETLPQVPPERFLEVDAPIPGRSEPVVSTLLYFIDNEIHHRGQGYVYLRLLGMEPPPFYVR